MKLDMGAAWTDAVALIVRHRSIILIVAGVFFFLPYLALSLLMPEIMNPMAAGPNGAPQDPEAMMELLAGPFLFAMMAIAILQGVGTIALLSLLTDNARPTLGEALGTGLKALLPYIATLLLQGLLAAVAFGLPLAVAIASGNAAITALVGLLALVGFVYVYVKFSLTIPVIAIEGQFNPVAVMRRSWQLTKGNSLRLFGFFLLLWVAFVVVSIVAGMFLGLPLALMGGTVSAVGNGLIGALSNTAMVIAMMGALAAVHAQLSGSRGIPVSDVFD